MACLGPYSKYVYLQCGWDRALCHNQLFRKECFNSFFFSFLNSMILVPEYSKFQVVLFQTTHTSHTKINLVFLVFKRIGFLPLPLLFFFFFWLVPRTQGLMHYKHMIYTKRHPRTRIAFLLCLQSAQESVLANFVPFLNCQQKLTPSLSPNYLLIKEHRFFRICGRYEFF